MSVGDTFAFYPYVSDNGQTYSVKLSAAEAAAGGFGAAGPFTQAWPYHYRDLRHVTGYNTANPVKKGRLICADNVNALYTSGGTWTLHGSTFQVQGAEGERRPANHVK